VVGREQPVDHGGLVLFGAPHLGQGLAQRAVEARADVLQAQRVHLDAVHEDDAHPGEGVVVELADGLGGHFPPGELLLGKGRPFGIEQAGQRVHSYLRLVSERAMRAPLAE